MSRIIINIIFLALLYGVWLLAKSFHELLEANRVVVAEIWTATLFFVSIAGLVRLWWFRKTMDWENLLEPEPAYCLSNHVFPSDIGSPSQDELVQVDQYRTMLTMSESNLANAKQVVKDLGLKFNMDGSIDYRLKENRGKRNVAESALEHLEQVGSNFKNLKSKVSGILDSPEFRFREWQDEVCLDFQDWKGRGIFLRKFDADLRSTTLSIRAAGLLSILVFVLISLLGGMAVILNFLISVLMAWVVYTVHMWYFSRQKKRPDTCFDKAFDDMQKIISTPESALKYFGQASA